MKQDISSATIAKERAPQIAALLLVFAVFAAPLKAQEQPVPLQFNVAYRCPGGITYTITKCTGSGYKEVCFWREEQNGHLVTEAYTQRVYMGGRLAPCKVEGAPPASGDYTKDLPSVRRIESELKGSDPTDTLARQAAIFDYLQQYTQRIKEARGYRGPYSPGEQKLLTDYARAGYDLTQSYTKTHTPAELTAFNRLKFRYEINDALNWIKQLEGQQAADTYKGAEASLARSYKRNQDRIQQQMNPQRAGGSSIAGDPVLDPMGIFAGSQANIENDPQTCRCLELGGAIDECEGATIMNIGKALEGEMAKSIGVAVNPARPRNGVILVGSYHSRTDLPEIALTWDGKAFLQKCGTLVNDYHTYTLRKSGAMTQIVVDNEPDPIVLTLRPDGSLSGPGNIPVKGNIISGYNNQYSCQTGTTNVNCGTTSTPIYSPSMQRCTISQLAPQPAPPPPPKATGLIGQVSEMLSAGHPVATIYGFRVTGGYASSTGMQLSFDNRYVTLDCGQAHVNAPYTVDNTISGFVIHVQNAGGAFLLAVAPDNTLRGSGSTAVNGKLVSSIQGDVVNFTPHSESCALGAFAPGKQNAMRASGGPIPAVPPAYSSPAIAPGAIARAPAPNQSSLPSSIATAPRGTRAQLRVLLSSNFNGTNPLAGQTVFVSRKPIDQILRELGVAVAAQATPGQAMKALGTQCHSAQGCSAFIQGLNKYYVTTTKLDASGKATLSATAGTGPYYFFAIVPDSGGSLVWDVPANLAAGDNTVVFNELR